MDAVSFFQLMSASFPLVGPGPVLLFVVVMLWTVVWKGLALWRAARNSHKRWFIALLIVNTLGILEIIYIFVIDKKTAPYKS